jgi:dienelactone hydrolase
MKKTLFFLFLNCTLIIFTGCGNIQKPAPSMNSTIKEENVSYSLDSVSMNGFVAYKDSANAKLPIVMIVHEWWGINDYVKNRAKQLAALGYFAMAVDLYGNGKTADDPDNAGKLAGPFYANPQMAKDRFDAALAKAKSYAAADANKIAAIGYCFGGGMVLNFARMGEDMKGVVSFHGSLLGVPADKSKLKAEILVCHGADDKFVSEQDVKTFKHQLDSIGANYRFVSYHGATHAFTNPNATEKGKKYNMPIAYNAQADSASFNEMKMFFNKIFK